MDPSLTPRCALALKLTRLIIANKKRTLYFIIQCFCFET
jgi:hypothetical protein